MAKRKGWDSLSQAYKDRLSRGGITKARYERGHKLDVARGHAETPEHGIRQAQKNPVKYRKYLAKKQAPPSRKATPHAQAITLNNARDAAYYNIKGRLETYLKYNEQTVLANVYGGDTSQSGTVGGMSLSEAQWTSRADTEELRSRARQQYQGNPWWYH